MIERYSLPEISNIWSDENKFSIWLKIEILACEANSKLGIIPNKSLNNIKKKAVFDVNEINKIEGIVKHDVIAFLTNVGNHIGSDARYVHYGLTSSDILDTTLSVQMKQAGELILLKLNKLRTILGKKAVKYKYLEMIGRTHGVHAEIITLGLKFALWYDEINRQIIRLEGSIDNISIGKISGAVGTYEHLNPSVEKYVCKKLGLKSSKISTQIIQRDIHAEYMMTVALIACSLDKFASEIRHHQKTEILELEEPFTKGQKGSSAMPHKKNPVICERISGLARILRGNTIPALENINLWHERDISHSSVERMIIPDSTMILYYMVCKFIEVVEGLKVNEQNILNNVKMTNGLIFSQKVLLKLIERGSSREEAYKIIQQNAMKCWEDGANLRDILLNDKRVMDILSNIEVEMLFQPSVKKNVDYIFKSVGL